MVWDRECNLVKGTVNVFDKKIMVKYYLFSFAWKNTRYLILFNNYNQIATYYKNVFSDVKEEATNLFNM